MLWIGWFGFNAGSELAADNVAGMAMAVTQISAAMAALAWMGCEFFLYKKTSVLGIASGAVAGLVAITPASGAVGPLGALVIGALSGTLCFFAATRLKKIFGYDDSLDVFGVHGVGGIIGALLTGIFCAESLGGSGFGVEGGMMDQLMVQSTGIAATIIYTGITSFILLKLVDALLGLRVLPHEEEAGLDVTSHNERGYNF
jgi:Amt family ammonium transporter